MESLKVAIIGCGTAGPAAALFLHQLGHKVEIFEKVSHPASIGAGILLQPTGQLVLNRLGLLDQISQLGSPVNQLYGRTSKNKTIMDLWYRDLNPLWFGLGIHRGSLFQTLYDELHRQYVSIHCSTEITSYQFNKNQMILKDSAANEYGPFDLIVVCDGARSQIRNQFTHFKRARPYPWGALWAILKDDEKIFNETLYQVYEGNQTMVGFLPTGKLPDSNQNLLSIFWSINVKEYSNWTDQDFSNWKKRVIQLEPRVEKYLGQIQKRSDLLLASYMDVIMSDWTNRENIVFLGDAGHAMSPQLGQGANIALIDAMILGDCVQKSNSLNDALTNWSILRRKHIRYYQWASRWLTPFFQSSIPGLGFLRDQLMGPSAKVRPFRKIMLESMAGVKQTLFNNINML